MNFPPSSNRELSSLGNEGQFIFQQIQIRTTIHPPHRNPGVDGGFKRRLIKGWLDFNGRRKSEVEAIWRKNLNKLLQSSNRWEKALGHYDSPAGNEQVIKVIADYFRIHCGFDVSEKNIAIFNGSQTAFFLLLNLLGGQSTSGKHRKILLPMVPEYIGYADMGLMDDIFQSQQPIIESLEEHLFKYKVDFQNLNINENTAAICVSRPTNPSGNALTDDEMKKLERLAIEHNIPMIVDCAYGLPFPGVVYERHEIKWHPGIINVYSLSKLGLPGLRTGIVVAKAEIIESLSRMNAIVSLATGGLGQALTLDLFQKNGLEKISKHYIRPYYTERRNFLLECIKAHWGNKFPYKIHKSEGAFFLWVWFPKLRIHSRQLYLKLKQRNVLVISGHYFFFGMEERTKHSNQCLRLSFTQNPNILEEGIRILGQELEHLH